MGSGDKFRFSWNMWRHWDLGVAVVFYGEHEVSIYINLVRCSIYIGLGKGYEEFEK